MTAPRIFKTRKNSSASDWNQPAKAFACVISAIIYSRGRQQLDNISEFCY